MITLTKNGNAIVFTFEDNAHYLFDGTISVPINSLTLITDNSQMATFKKSASNDIFISATYAELGMSKSELESWFKENACGSTGGGGVTSGEVETMIETSLEDYYDIDEVDAALSGKADTSAVTEAISSAVSGKVNTSEYNTYTAATDSRLAEDEEVTAAGLNALNDALSGKQDTLIAGSGITISGNVISSEGGNKVVELTQAQYDALVDKDPDTFYIITDAEAIDINNYYTKTEVNTALAAKANTATTYTKTEVDNAITAATSTKQDTLVSGTNIKTINNQSILGSGNIEIQGGGASYTAGDGIDITNDVISVTGKVDTSAITTSMSSASTNTQVPSAKAVYDQLGGLKLVKITQAAYDALATKDNSTLFVIVD